MRKYSTSLIEKFDIRILDMIFDFLDTEIEKGTTSPNIGVNVQMGETPTFRANFFYIRMGGLSSHLPYCDAPSGIIIESDDGHYELIKEI